MSTFFIVFTIKNVKKRIGLILWKIRSRQKAGIIDIKKIALKCNKPIGFFTGDNDDHRIEKRLESLEQKCSTMIEMMNNFAEKGHRAALSKEGL